MRCEEARRRLRRGPDTEAEEHLAVCATCFDAIEREDSLVVALREARPVPTAVPATLAPRVIARWRLRRRLPWAAAVAALVVASVGAAVLLWALAPLLSEPVWLIQVTFGSLLAPWAGTLLALVEVLRSRLVENPALLATLMIVCVAAGAGWIALDREAHQPARELVS
jgi:hypothetical protein